MTSSLLGARVEIAPCTEHARSVIFVLNNGIGMGNVFSQLFPEIWTRFEQEAFEAYRKTPNGIFIALVGRTGSGMSRLIQDATGSYETNVCPEEQLNSEPYTTSIQDYGFTIPGIDFSDFPLFFIDTPGFDYSINNDEHTALEKLRSWLRTYKPPNTEIDGLIFMHNVCTPELHERTLYMPRKRVIDDLCGKNNLHRVVSVSSHWKNLIPEEEGEKQAEIDKYWTWMAGNKSEMKRYETPSPGNAWEILKPLVTDAQTAREKRTRDELDNLRVYLANDVYLRIGDFLGRKAALLKGIIARLGQDGFVMTTGEESMYARLNEEAALLWREVEKEVNVTELERWLTSGEKKQDAEDP